MKSLTSARVMWSPALESPLECAQLRMRTRTHRRGLCHRQSKKFSKWRNKWTVKRWGCVAKGFKTCRTFKNILRKCHWSKYASNYFYVTRGCWYLRNVSLQSNLSSHLVTFKIKSSFQVIKLVSQVNRGRLWRIIVWHHAWCAHPVPRWIWEFELFQMIYGAQLRAFTLPVFNNCDAIVPLHGAGLHRVNLDWRPTGKGAIRILSSQGRLTMLPRTFWSLLCFSPSILRETSKYQTRLRFDVCFFCFVAEQSLSQRYQKQISSAVRGEAYKYITSSAI